MISAPCPRVSTFSQRPGITPAWREVLSRTTKAIPLMKLWVFIFYPPSWRECAFSCPSGSKRLRCGTPRGDFSPFPLDTNDSADGPALATRLRLVPRKLVRRWVECRFPFHCEQATNYLEFCSIVELAPYYRAAERSSNLIWPSFCKDHFPGYSEPDCRKEKTMLSVCESPTRPPSERSIMVPLNWPSQSPATLSAGSTVARRGMGMRFSASVCALAMRISKKKNRTLNMTNPLYNVSQLKITE